MWTFDVNYVTQNNIYVQLLATLCVILNYDGSGTHGESKTRCFSNTQLVSLSAYRICQLRLKWLVSDTLGGRQLYRLHRMK